jgi:hypothetical protein
MTLHDHGRYQVVPRSPDRGTGMIAGLQKSKETFGQTGGPVGRPVHNRFPRIMQGHLETAAKSQLCTVKDGPGDPSYAVLMQL